MRTICLVLITSLSLLGASARNLAAQDRREPDRREPDRRDGMMRMFPVMAVLDADGDSEISSGEIERAAAALKTLDQNKDGRLSDDELRPNFGGFGGPAGVGGFARRGFGGGFGGPRSPDQSVDRLMQLDRNGDGKLAKEELPAEQQNAVVRADADMDGFATREELTRMFEQQNLDRDDGPPGGLGGPRGAGGSGPAGGGFGPGGGFGLPDPQSFVDRAFEFDADKDGKLTREELSKMAEQFGRGFGGFRRGDPDRPQRPVRPE